jgi:hypothetical protein
MKRNINIINQFVKDSIPNTDQISIDNIDSLVNYSVDSIICGTLEYVNDSEFESSLLVLLEKIRDEGNIIIKFVNFKKLFIEYINQQVSGAKIFNDLANKKNILSPDKVVNILNKNSFMILKIDQNEDHFIIMAQRIKNR